MDAVSRVYFLTSMLSYLLIGLNYVLRTVCIMMVDWIGYPTETERLSKTTSVTFIVQFFNSGVLLLLINANLSEQPFSFGLTSGSLSDFNGRWFQTIGNVLVGAMMFNLYYPILEAVLYWFLRWQGRCRDRGCRCPSAEETTKQKAIQGYLDMYAGPVYYMHYKYSSIMTITFITFMYGFGIPILFPIACVSFLVLYVVEKLLLFYGYRLPPMYDERLSEDVLNKLQFAPVLYLAFGYWMASNDQLLSNEHLSAKRTSDQVFHTDHTYGSVFHPEGWEGFEWPLLLAFWFLIAIYFFGYAFEACFSKCCPSLIIGDVAEELNEDIDFYFDTLDEDDRKWSIGEEQYSRDNLLTSQLMTDEQFSRLQASIMTKRKTLQGVHSYDILANPLYFDDFQYISASREDRDKLIIDGDNEEGNDSAVVDLIRVALNLAYLTENEARSF